MPEQTLRTPRNMRIPGLDPAVMPMIGLGLGLTGVLLGVRPRLAPWPLALTALAALLYRDPTRTTPDEAGMIFAPADGVVANIDELYEHRFLHTDALSVSIIASPLDVPIQRSPVSGTVRYLDHAAGEYRPIWDAHSSDHGERQFIGIQADWGPLLLVIAAGPLARRITCHVNLGDQVDAGERLATVRLGARVDVMLPRDIVERLPIAGQSLRAGVDRLGRIVHP